MREIYLDHIAAPRGLVCQDLRAAHVTGNQVDIRFHVDCLFPVKHKANAMSAFTRLHTEQRMKRGFQNAGISVHGSGKSGRERGIAGGS